MNARGGSGEGRIPLRDAAAERAADDPARDEMVEIATLSQKRTGVAGTILVPTRMAAHGPRISGGPGGRSGMGRVLSVTPEDPPRAITMGLPARIAREGEAGVLAWAALNRNACCAPGTKAWSGWRKRPPHSLTV